METCIPFLEKLKNMRAVSGEVEMFHQEKWGRSLITQLTMLTV